jgi:hypothetical protein
MLGTIVGGDGDDDGTGRPRDEHLGLEVPGQSAKGETGRDGRAAADLDGHAVDKDWFGAAGPGRNPTDQRRLADDDHPIRRRLADPESQRHGVAPRAQP